ncbi:uncharacterized protein RHTO_02285 [Rhodotorula toruloides NP11]|uniref:Uncharacterized protein n=1 Tax=Rhodotorula toruloides (strain NP11) TaxID=1130832 RepID=M7WS46_RHOT1|nr:uncharacterized protein RHTO_02285 [Rhodotorula toruloides NP11]EMS20891.1 hypothetical protein RHTO_02285 [Rhodotorula toruloides NP11]
MGWASVLAGVGMAVGPPLAYGDQYWSINKKHDSRGFSIDVCAILIIANLTRLVYWLGKRSLPNVPPSPVHPHGRRPVRPPLRLPQVPTARLGRDAAVPHRQLLAVAELWSLPRVLGYPRRRSFGPLPPAPSLRLLRPAARLDRARSGGYTPHPASPRQLPRQIDRRIPSFSPRRLVRRRRLQARLLLRHAEPVAIQGVRGVPVRRRHRPLRPDVPVPPQDRRRPSRASRVARYSRSSRRRGAARIARGQA